MKVHFLSEQQELGIHKMVEVGRRKKNQLDTFTTVIIRSV